MNSEQLKAADGLLDIGISIPLRPLRLFKLMIVPRVTMKRPPLGGLLRILRVYLSLGVTEEDLSKMTNDEQNSFVAQHGKKIAKMVALSVWSGFFSGMFAPFLAWWMLWRCHPVTLFNAALELVTRIDSSDFTNIIRLYARHNLLAPNLSQKTKRS